MDSKQEKKCKKIEGKLAACDYSCDDVKTEAPTKPPTEKPEPIGRFFNNLYTV